MDSPVPGDFLQVPEWSTGIPVDGQKPFFHTVGFLCFVLVTWFTHELLYIQYVTDAQLFVSTGTLSSCYIVRY